MQLELFDEDLYTDIRPEKLLGKYKVDFVNKILEKFEEFSNSLDDFEYKNLKTDIENIETWMTKFKFTGYNLNPHKFHIYVLSAYTFLDYINDDEDDYEHNEDYIDFVDSITSIYNHEFSKLIKDWLKIKKYKPLLNIDNKVLINKVWYNVEHVSTNGYYILKSLYKFKDKNIKHRFTEEWKEVEKHKTLSKRKWFYKNLLSRRITKALTKAIQQANLEFVKVLNE